MQQFKRSFWQLLFFLTLALSLTTFAFIKRPKFQSSLTVTTARVWGHSVPDSSIDLDGFKNDPAVKGVFGILNKLFSDKKTAVSLFIHQFLLNKTNLAKPEFEKTFTYTNRFGRKLTWDFTISNNARTEGLWTTKGERALMNPNFQLSSLTPAQKDQNWLSWLRDLIVTTAVFNSNYASRVQGAFNLEKTRTNIHNLFTGWAVEEMKAQLKDDEVLFTKSLVAFWEEVRPKLKGEQREQGLGTQGNEGLPGTQGAQGSRGPAGQNGQVEKEAVIGLSIGLGVVFCLFFAYVIYQKRIFSTFKNPKKSTKI